VAIEHRIDCVLIYVRTDSIYFISNLILKDDAEKDETDDEKDENSSDDPKCPPFSSSLSDLSELASSRGLLVNLKIYRPKLILKNSKIESFRNHEVFLVI
jgi:hypothetical protein